LNGLEKILAEIKAEANAEAAQIIAEANAKAEETLSAARAEAMAKESKMNAEAAQRLAETRRAFVSAAALMRRQRILAQKRELLAETLDMAKEALYALPEVEYFSLLARLVARSAHAGDGVLYLSQQDRARMPQGFAIQVQADLPVGGSLSISSDSRPIDGGFILAYGDVEENCSFAALFDARADELNDLVCGVLFS